MDVAGEYLFDAPQALVWDSMQDPNVLGSVMPGGKGFAKVGENKYDGMLEVKVGPVQGLFQGQITLSDIVAPDSYQIVVDGKGAPGFVKATGRMSLEARGSQTHMTYSGTAQVGGRIASVGQRLIDSAARSIIRQSLEALNEYLKIQVAQQTPAPVAATAMPAVPVTSTNGVNPAPAALSEPTTVTASVAPPVTTYKPPSQYAMGMKVAKDVFNDLVPARYQPWLIGAVALVILLIIWSVLRR